MPDARLNPAIEAAAALSGNAGLVGLFRSRPLPNGVSDVLRLLSRAQPDGVDPDLRVKLEYYVQNVLLHPGASPYRILGVEPGAPRDQMRDNMRSLMLWLHPDAAGQDWRSAFAPRVLDAWRAVSTSHGDRSKGDACKGDRSNGDVPVASRSTHAVSPQRGGRAVSGPQAVGRQGRAPVRGRPRVHRSVRRTSSWRRLRVGLVAVIALVLLVGVVFLTLERPHAYSPHYGLWGRLVAW